MSDLAKGAVTIPSWSDDDPYTMDARLCDDDGIVRGGAMHHGTDYPCTGHAHFAGEHIKCTSMGHPETGLPADLEAALRDPGALFPCPVCGAAPGASCGHGPNRERLALRAQIEGSSAAAFDADAPESPSPIAPNEPQICDDPGAPSI